MKEHVVLSMNALSYFKIGNRYYMEKGSIKRNKVSIRKMDIKAQKVRKQEDKNQSCEEKYNN